ncbi:hypothetical protein [Amycolatopsis sp. 3B14]|uniref:hypothetical protein n=1 Tax=Amycolatopsis sp. 3B14 TaxID=3243600 RepID=UPI003D957FDB
MTERKKHPYALKGLLFHESCGRRMQGNWIRERAHYRCRYPNEYALANRLDHPLTVHLREDVLLEPLDTWLAQVFAPGKIEQSLTAIEESQPDHAPAAPRRAGRWRSATGNSPGTRPRSKPAQIRRWWRSGPGRCSRRRRCWRRSWPPRTPGRGRTGE